MDRAKKERVEFLNLFDFVEDKEERKNLISNGIIKANENDYDESEEKTFSYQEIVGDTQDASFKVCAHFWLGSWSQYGLSLEYIKEKIKRVADTKCYHFGNMEKDVYMYSYKDKNNYWLCIENEKHIIIIRHIKEINDFLTGKEQASYPACCVYMFEKKDNEIEYINSGYGNYKDDIRYKILCDEFKILEFSTNRIHKKSNPKDFYEAQFTYQQFKNYWENKTKEN